MNAKMSAEFSPRVILTDGKAQSTAVTLTNTGDVPISFGLPREGDECENAGIEMMIPTGSGRDALCTERAVGDMTLRVGTPGWNIKRTRPKGGFAMWTVYAERDVTLKPGDSINIVLGSVISNSSVGTATVKFIFHTPCAGGEFRAELTKNLSPAVTELSVIEPLDTGQYISPDIASGEQCEGFIAIPYLCPPGSPGSYSKEKLVYVKWKTENAFSCTLSHMLLYKNKNETEEVPVCGEKIVRLTEDKHTFTLTAYGEDKIGSAFKAVTYPKE